MFDSILSVIERWWKAFRCGMKSPGWLPVIAVAGLLTLTSCGEIERQCGVIGLPLCPVEALCDDGVCRRVCITDNDCVRDDDGTRDISRVCIDGLCLPPLPSCSSDADCGPGELCEAVVIGNSCLPVSTECVTDIDCDPGFCDTTTAQPSCLPQAPPPAVAVCNSDFDCDVGEICDNAGIPECVPTGSVDTVLEVTFDNGTSNQAWTSGGWLGFPVTFSEHSAGGNPDGFLEYNFSGAPIRWLLGNAVQTFWLLSATDSLDTIDFSIDVKVIEAGAGVIGGEVAAVVTNNDGTSYMGPFDPVRTDTTTVGWQTISRNGLTANNFCRVDFSTGNQDCSDHPDFSCPYGPSFPCMTGGFFIRSEEFSSEPVRLGFDNWRMTFRVTP